VAAQQIGGAFRPDSAGTGELVRRIAAQGDEVRQPKTIVRNGGKGAGAIVGFANFLLRLYQTERPRAVIVGWETLDVPRERHKKFPAYQS
jgi:hypothetical protein